MVVLLVVVEWAHADTATEEELKAALIYKFAQFTDWPSFSHEFSICVLGSAPFGGALNKLEGKTLKEAPVVVKRLLAAESAGNCQMAILIPQDPARLTGWLASLQHRPILTVSDSPDAWNKGVMIVFAVESNRVRFDINASAAREAGLNLRAQMLRLAREIR